MTTSHSLWLKIDVRKVIRFRFEVLIRMSLKTTRWLVITIILTIFRCRLKEIF